MSKTSFAVVFLAGGEAKRFPGKLTAPFAGRPMLERVVRALRDASDELVLSVGPHFDPTIAAALGVRTIVDDVPARGPLGGLLSAAAHLRQAWLFAAPGDAPFLDVAFVRTLWGTRASGDEAIVARESRGGRVHPLPAFYRRETILRAAPRVFDDGRRSLVDLLERIATRFVEVPPGMQALLNVNSPDDYRAAHTLLEAAGADRDA